MDYVLSSKIRYQNDNAKTLVEIGVALFCSDDPNSDTAACIKEPAAIYAMVSFFQDAGHTVGDYLNGLFIGARGTSHGNIFEEILAWNFFHLFSSASAWILFLTFVGPLPSGPQSVLSWWLSPGIPRTLSTRRPLLPSAQCPLRVRWRTRKPSLTGPLIQWAPRFSLRMSIVDLTSLWFWKLTRQNNIFLFWYSLDLQEGSQSRTSIRLLRQWIQNRYT
jgi:hypothetical protein